MDNRLRIVVTGLIGQYPLGGVAWDYMQYVLGLHQAGHDVYYLEDTGFWPFNPSEGGLAENGVTFNINYLDQVFQQFGLSGKWMFRFTRDTNDTQWYGMPERSRREVIASADLLINVSGCLLDPADYRHIPHMAYIDSDPVFTQVKLAAGDAIFNDQIRTHDSHFTFAENPNHCMPETDFNWIPTRQPIVLDQWRTDVKPERKLTTIMNWTSYDALVHNGIEYGQKDREFEPYLSLPEEFRQRNIPLGLELAVNEGKTTRTPRQGLISHGWQLADPNVVCPDINAYRDYISRSYAEWSVAKHGYVKGRSGWFSCRSACYLAAGRPVIVQDTGFSEILPVGEGIHAFNAIDDVYLATEKLLGNYRGEQQAALDIATHYFCAQTVLNDLIQKAMSPDNSRLHAHGYPVDTMPQSSRYHGH